MQDALSQHYVVYSVSRIVQPDYCVMQVRVLTQAHSVSNYTGCQCTAVSNTSYVC